MSSLQEKLAAARAALEAEKAKITPELRETMTLYAEKRRLREERLAAQRELLEQQLEMWLDAAEDACPGAKLAGVCADEENAFVLRYAGAKAHATWEKALGDSATNKKIDLSEVKREYAMASIFSWNGETNLHGLASEKGPALLALMKEYPGLATGIIAKVVELAKMSLDDRKS